LDRLVEVAVRQRLDELERLAHGVELIAVEAAAGVDVLLAPAAHSRTSMPMDRAVPSTWATASSSSIAFRSGILVSAMRRTWSLVTEPTFSMRGFWAPFSTPEACLRRNVVGGVLVMNVNDRSSK